MSAIQPNETRYKHFSKRCLSQPTIVLSFIKQPSAAVWEESDRAVSVEPSADSFPTRADAFDALIQSTEKLFRDYYAQIVEKGMDEVEADSSAMGHYGRGMLLKRLIESLKAERQKS